MPASLEDQLNQTDVSPGLSAWRGSPDSLVVSTLDPDTWPDEPVRAIRLP